MSAPPFAVRQYCDLQNAADVDAAIEAYQKARVQWELERLARQPAPAVFCAVEEATDSDLPLPTLMLAVAAGLILWGLIGWAGRELLLMWSGVK